jgi:hemerythrin
MFVWNDSYSVNVDSIDSQHQTLFRLAGDLHRAILAGAVKASLGELLVRLVQYTETHFAYEEELMRQADYPELTAHKREHDDLARRVRDFQKDFEEGRIGTAIGLLQFLKEWLQKHLTESDHKYTPYLRAKGLAVSHR